MRITLVSSCGLVLEQDGSALLIDALNKQFRCYYGLPPEVFAKMLAGEPPYDAVCGVLFTHAHPDHYSASRTEQLRAACGAPVFLPQPNTPNRTSCIVRQAELPGTKASAMSTSPANRVMSPAGIRSCVRFLRREAVLRPEVLRFLFAMFPKTRSLFYIMKQGALRAALSVTMEEFRYYSILSLYHGKSQMAIYFPSISR